MTLMFCGCCLLPTPIRIIKTGYVLGRCVSRGCRVVGSLTLVLAIRQDGDTALMIAAKRWRTGNVIDAVDERVAAGADVTDAVGEVTEADKALADAVEELVAHDADPNVKNKVWRTRLGFSWCHQLTLTGTSQEGKTCLEIAESRGVAEAFQAAVDRGTTRRTLPSPMVSFHCPRIFIERRPTPIR